MSTIDISGMYFSTSSSNKIVFTNSDGEPYGEADIQAQPSNAISLQTSDFTWAISMPSGTYSVTVLNYSTNKTSDPYFFNYTAPPFISTINFTQLQDGRGTIDISGMYFSTEEDGNTIVFANSDEPVPYAELFIQAQSTTELSFTSDIFMPSGTYSSVTVRNNITNMISVQYTSFDYRFTKAIAYVIITAGQFSAVGTTPTINRTFANGLGNPISTPTGLSGTPTYTTSLTGSPLTSSSPSAALFLIQLRKLPMSLLLQGSQVHMALRQGLI
jgi:formylmethanofuran dehydrogenase subunit D